MAEEPRSGDAPPIPTIADIAKGTHKVKLETNQGVELFIEEIQQLDRDSLKAWLTQTIEAETKRFTGDTDLRKSYAYWLLAVCWTWVVFLILAVAADGWAKLNGITLFSDALLLGLSGGTTITVLGLVTIVATSLFPKQSSRSSLEQLISPDVRKQKDEG